MCTRYGRTIVYCLLLQDTRMFIEVAKMPISTHDTMEIQLQHNSKNGGATFDMSFLVNEAWNPHEHIPRTAHDLKKCRLN